MTNFGHFRFDVQVADLYRFMRKILEKYNWDPQLGKDMLKRIRCCTADFACRKGESEDPFSLSGEVLEAGKLLFLPQ